MRIEESRIDIEVEEAPGNLNALENCNYQQKYIKWDRDLKNDFICGLKDEDIAKLTVKLNMLQESVKNISRNDVDKIVDDFNIIFLDSARQVKMIKRNRTYKKNK